MVLGQIPLLCEEESMSFLPNLAACDDPVRELAGETLPDSSGMGCHWRTTCKQRMLDKAGQSSFIFQNLQNEEFCDRKCIMRKHKIGRI